MDGDNYEFIAYEDLTIFKNIFKAENHKMLEKWGLVQNLEICKFRFNLNFDIKDMDKFLKDFFNDKKVRNTLSALKFEDKNVDKVRYNKLSTKYTNMDIFEPIYQEIVNRENGYIRKDYEEYIDEIHIPDKLKAALINEESEYYCIFNEELRNEFLFHLFKRITIGGSLCQYEDGVFEYLNMTKSFYKDLVSASKDPDSNEIVIKSIPLEITGLDGINLFGKYHPQNFLYLTIDPFQRHVNVLYHKWVSWW
jgi:hypothetical protein